MTQPGLSLISPLSRRTVARKYRMTYLLHFLCCLLPLLTLTTPTRAQTIVDITYNKDTGGAGTLVTETFFGAFCRVTLPLSSVQGGGLGTTYIVRPVNDPVLEFIGFQVRNNTALPWYGFTFSIIPLPIGNPQRTMLGFIDDGTTPGGIGTGGSPFTPVFSGALGLYNGDAVDFLGLPLFSQLSFTGGNLAIGDTATFDLLNAIPPPNQTNYVVFVTGLAAPEPSSVLLLLGVLSAAITRFPLKQNSIDCRPGSMP